MKRITLCLLVCMTVFSLLLSGCGEQPSNPTKPVANESESNTENNQPTIDIPNITPTNPVSKPPIDETLSMKIIDEYRSLVAEGLSVKDIADKLSTSELFKNKCTVTPVEGKKIDGFNDDILDLGECYHIATLNNESRLDLYVVVNEDAGSFVAMIQPQFLGHFNDGTEISEFRFDATETLAILILEE